MIPHVSNGVPRSKITPGGVCAVSLQVLSIGPRGTRNSREVSAGTRDRVPQSTSLVSLLRWMASSLACIGKAH